MTTWKQSPWYRAELRRDAKKLAAPMNFGDRERLSYIRRDYAEWYITAICGHTHRLHRGNYFYAYDRNGFSEGDHTTLIGEHVTPHQDGNGAWRAYVYAGGTALVASYALPAWFCDAPEAYAVVDEHHSMPRATVQAGA